MLILTCIIFVVCIVHWHRSWQRRPFNSQNGALRSCSPSPMKILDPPLLQIVTRIPDHGWGGDVLCCAAELCPPDVLCCAARWLGNQGETRHRTEALLQFLHRPCTPYEITMPYIIRWWLTKWNVNYSRNENWKSHIILCFVKNDILLLELDSCTVGILRDLASQNLETPITCQSCCLCLFVKHRTRIDNIWLPLRTSITAAKSSVGEMNDRLQMLGIEVNLRLLCSLLTFIFWEASQLQRPLFCQCFLVQWNQVLMSFFNIPRKI